MRGNTGRRTRGARLELRVGASRPEGGLAAAPESAAADLELDGHAADDARRRADDEELVVERDPGFQAAANQVADAEHELDLGRFAVEERDSLVDLHVESRGPPGLGVVDQAA